MLIRINATIKSFMDDIRKSRSKSQNAVGLGASRKKLASVESGDNLISPRIQALLYLVGIFEHSLILKHLA